VAGWESEDELARVVIRRAGTWQVRGPVLVAGLLKIGIVVGPHGLGLVDVDLPLQIVSFLGLGFLLFLDGLEIDVPAADNRPEALENSRKNV
jgi:NhaP-type Na+/H+ or K+/H+ antiporter